MNGNLERKCLAGDRTKVCEVSSSVHKTNAVFSTAVVSERTTFFCEYTTYILRGCVWVIQSIDGVR